MKICRNIPEIREFVRSRILAGHSIGLVPTMGALHAGHVSLATTARAACDTVVATIFVNPTQFGDVSDLENYPRTEEQDLAKLQTAGVDAVFIPGVGDMYPEGDETIVETTKLAQVLHGAVRPGHFRGVTTVVARLFNICTPSDAFFGEKDFQQLQVIKRMVRDLHFPIAIHGVETVREDDGLAMSSRNTRLTPEDRAAAVVIHKSLLEAQARASQGGEVADLEATIRNTIATEPRGTLRGLDITHSQTLEPATGKIEGPLVAMISVEFGGILLIDQKELNV